MLLRLFCNIFLLVPISVVTMSAVATVCCYILIYLLCLSLLLFIANLKTTT